nr:HlyD family efflux transporter periplasmic adaptor subunit [uncultured Lachnoanaerobaculum sp.]
MKKKFIIIPAIIALGIGGFFFIKSRQSANTDLNTYVPTAIVTKQDISSEISSSGTITPKDTYNITALISGDIIAADFNIGDTVSKDQVLYQIDKSSIESDINSSNNSLSKANTGYASATKDYEKAKSEFSGNLYRSTRRGYIKELSIQSGDKISGGTKLATIYNDNVMNIRIPFLSPEAQNITAGMTGTLTLTETGEQIEGRVLSVSSMDQTLDGGRLVRNVTFEVTNPGGLTDKTTANATVGEMNSTGDGTFEASTNVDMSADLAEGVEIEKVLVNVGDFVEVGTPIFKMTSESADKLLKTYRDAVDTAQGNVDAAKKGVDTAKKTYDEYTIKSPIAGKVISKNYKVGDKVGSSGSNKATTMAVIYDMSSYTFKMSVDEKDITKVQSGQKVRIKSDAFPDQDYSGTVTNVSLESTSQNGVSTYPVTITLDETYNLLPGMNVDGYITLESAKDALTIPSGALMRGNKVYVKDTTATEQKADAGESAGGGDGLIPAGFREVTVTTGVINADFVQITSGLNEGDEVYVDESASMDAAAGMDGMNSAGGEPAQGGAGAGGAGAGGAGSDAGGADSGDAGAGGE